MKRFVFSVAVIALFASCKPEITKTVKIINNSDYTVSFHYSPKHGGTNAGYNVIPDETKVVSYTVEQGELSEDSCCACVRDWGLSVVNDSMEITKDIRDEIEWKRDLIPKRKGGEVNCIFEFDGFHISEKD